MDTIRKEQSRAGASDNNCGVKLIDFSLELSSIAWSSDAGFSNDRDREKLRNNSCEMFMGGVRDFY